jgi:hypothetical protein
MRAGDSNGICRDTDECEVKKRPCLKEKICQNTLGSYTCNCETGFEMNSDNECVDIDECELGISSCNFENQACENTEGSYS